MEISYKAKYQQLKMQYMHAVDTAFRLGFEQGKQQAELDQVAQQQQAEQDMAQAQAGAMGDPSASAPGEMPQDAQQEPEMEPDSEHPGGSELDQHIAKLESMLGKAEAQPEELQKALHEIKALRKSQLQAIELKKSARAIKEISKALHRPAFKLSKQASFNMNDNAKRAVTLQHKIVDDVMKKWEEEEVRAAKSIGEILQIEGLTKKE